MTLQPLLGAATAIQIHVLAALAALALGTWQMVGAKGVRRHRRLGWIWAALMATVVVTSFFIHEIRQWGPFSWIHLLSLLTLATLPLGLFAARRGRRTSHARAMTALFFGALVVTGLFTLLPGRVMHAVVFGG